MVKKLNSTQEQEIINQYLYGDYTFQQLSQKYSCSISVIRKALKTQNISGKTDPQKWQFSEENQNNIIQLYLSGNSCPEIGRLLKINSNRIRRLLVKYQIPRRDESHCKQRHSINENYFDHIDTPEKAYILGLFYADGCVTPSKNSSKIVFKKGESEFELLSQIKELVEYDNTIKESTKSIRLVFFNQHICQQLQKLGVNHKKTFNLQFPNFLEPKYYGSFILGVFDGDGSIHQYTKSKNRGLFAFSITGYVPFLTELSQIISEICEVNCNKVSITKKNPLIGSISWCGRNNIFRIKNIIYKDCKIFLRRKKEIFDQCQIKS